MSLIQKFSKLSSRAKAGWIVAVIVIFTVMVGLATAGDVYNNFARNLAVKTNNIVVLPSVKVLPFGLGLDLQGGAHLVYQADVTNIPEADRASAMESARDIVERRVNTFGVSEPVVQVNKGVNGEYRIIAELAGIKDVDEAIKLIGETPILEFKEQGGEIPVQEVSTDASSAATVDLNLDAGWKNTELTGKYLKRSAVQFNPNDGTPEVSLQFDAEGAKLFEDITARNLGQPVAIFLDGYIISAPTVNDKITGGEAVISGQFSVDEAKLLVKRLNSGALPVPISLVAQKTMEASLGSRSIDNSLLAGLIGLLLVSLFMILYYRLPGLLSVLSLAVYGLTVLAIFKALPLWLALVLIIVMIGLIFYTFNELKIFNGGLAMLFAIIGLLLFFYAVKTITLTLSGIAGLILSIGMAVDANILIFARISEELKAGKQVRQAVDDGFKRAWPSIRDGNISTIITCFILMFFGTSTVQGFGTTLFIGVSVSLFSAIVITRTLFILILGDWLEKRTWLLNVRRPKVEVNR
ncbi:TPA: protein translocase subunit SecD [Candidatus Falkowbacteria bacterium]|nr:MAG: Preprotein translocase subunit SecD [Candidatus Falkowbacteria bacterium GW2011_GWF2_43_32]HBA36576.1 protein translocase subunit SecD [Candidatus Falkowbacteria bacterium]